jgi:hypothetical protein
MKKTKSIILVIALFIILVNAFFLILIRGARAASIQREYKFSAGTAMTVGVVNNSDGTQTITLTNVAPANGIANTVTATTNASPGLGAGIGSQTLPVLPTGYVNIPINGDSTTWIPYYRPGG